MKGRCAAECHIHGKDHQQFLKWKSIVHNPNSRHCAGRKEPAQKNKVASSAHLYPIHACASGGTLSAMQHKKGQPFVCMDSGASAHFFNKLECFQALRSTPKAPHNFISLPELDKAGHTSKAMGLATMRWRHEPCAACDLTATKKPRGRDCNGPLSKNAPAHKGKRDETETKLETPTKMLPSPTMPIRQRVHSDVKTMPRSTRGCKCFAAFVHEPYEMCREAREGVHCRVSISLRRMRANLKQSGQSVHFWC
mmetsp:Transcript_35111/g.48868  ORF Transcript_35111/g.48868 Transcript_35111/m.48868 type:complete len:252 (-) Transcript_35111:120-875(-)